MLIIGTIDTVEMVLFLLYIERRVPCTICIAIYVYNSYPNRFYLRILGHVHLKYCNKIERIITREMPFDLLTAICCIFYISPFHLLLLAYVRIRFVLQMKKFYQTLLCWKAKRKCSLIVNRRNSTLEQHV